MALYEFRESRSADTESERTDTSSRLPLIILFFLPLGLRISLTFYCITFYERLRYYLSYEIESGIRFLLYPVWFGIGAIIYFALPFEPSFFVVSALTLLSLTLLFILSDHAHLRIFLLVLGLASLGIFVSQSRALLLDTPTLSDSLSVTIEGRVVNTEHRPDGRIRYTLDISPDGIRHPSLIDFSGLLRVTDRAGGPVAGIGDTLTGYALLSPPSGPSYPGGYSPSFRMWFLGLGGTGFFLGHPTLTDSAPDITIGDWLTRLRSDISLRLRSSLPSPSGGLAAALIVGDRSGVQKSASDVLRRSGLAHILAISGLHMGLVSLAVFGFFRFCFSLFPMLVSHYPTKKWGASIALIAATCYLFLSGSPVSAQRAYIMVSIMLLAILFDRRALTMRNVSIAALIVLFFAPHAILMPGFQMSFAAVAVLVATYEWLSDAAQRGVFSNSFLEGSLITKFLVRTVGGLALTALMAGLATSIFVSYHFHHLPLFGLFANLFAMPVVSVILIPFALLSVLMFPLGIEFLTLPILGYSIDYVIWVADFFATPEELGATGYIPVYILCISSIGLLTGCLFRTRLRFFGVLLILFSLTLIPLRSIPDILVLENGKQVGVVSDGELKLLHPRSQKFSTNAWRRAFTPDNLSADTPTSPDSRHFACDGSGCVVRASGVVMSVPSSILSFVDDCRLADIILITFPLSVSCSTSAVIIDADDLSRYGSHSFFVDASGEFSLRRSYTGNFRPWIGRQL